MKSIFLFFITLICTHTVFSQYVYTINADSVKITNHCDTAELIIENHSQNVPGFLFNKGRGRTEFRRAVKLSDSTLLFGGDTLLIRGSGNVTASNGLSLTNKVVQLGQDIAQPGNPAALQNDREIPYNGEHTISFRVDSTEAGKQAITFKKSTINAQGNGDEGNLASLTLGELSTGTQSSITRLYDETQLKYGPYTARFYDYGDIEMGSTDKIRLNASANSVWVYNTDESIQGEFGKYGIGFYNPTFDARWLLNTHSFDMNTLQCDISIRDNGHVLIGKSINDDVARLQVDGAATFQRVVAPKAANYAMNIEGDNFKVFTNEGASAPITYTLPTNPTAGLTYTLYVQSSNGISIHASLGTTIRIGANVTPAGGTISSTSVGNALTLVAINNTEWIATSYTMPWTF